MKNLGELRLLDKVFIKNKVSSSIMIVNVKYIEYNDEYVLIIIKAGLNGFYSKEICIDAIEAETSPVCTSICNTYQISTDLKLIK